MASTIKRFEGKYRFLSNFYPSDVMFIRDWDGFLFKYWASTVEHAYQASKAISNMATEYVLKSPTPGEAKRRGRILTMRPDWDTVKDAIMLDLVWKKFLNHKDLKEKLLNTKDAILEEGNSWNDTYWGKCRGVGLNKLGIILMKVREELRNG